MPKLAIVVTSTRPGRIGLPIAEWFLERAAQHGAFEATLVDLKEVNLPALDEPKHPRLHQYEHAHTKAWSKTVSAADAFVFLIPEYNGGMPPALLNALNYLFTEWNYKAAALLSYGGMAGGARSAQMTKQMLTSLKMMPIPEGIAVISAAQQMDEAGRFKGGEAYEKSAKTSLDELLRWSRALGTMREA